ncbi:Chloride Channel (ClC) Family [Phytophthora palmivora]|uniref:Chloride Channel (ClC) Family n=1 Tax=Phytophthora palmivora TaxID=4796 RepID=A0A2P4XDV9_9STRA|nr:Chloride Channel (ClC) Family [Phytophthora palmivora]
MVACIASYFVGGMFTSSIYDILAIWADVSSVCYDFNEDMLSQTAVKDYMGSAPVIFTRDTTYNEANQALGSIRHYALEVGIARFLAVHYTGVGEDVNLYLMHKRASISSWTQVYVIKFGKLLGAIHLDSSLTKVRKEAVPIHFS